MNDATTPARAHRWLGWASAGAMALIYSLLLLTSNSPLFRAYGADSAIFVTIGRAIAGGAVPYVDIFDHKGPVIFYINALAQAVWPSVVSVWALEALWLFASLLVLRRIARALGVRSIWAVGLVQLAYLALMAVHLDGGNYTEEYCNLFTLLAIAWGLDVAKAQAPDWRHTLGVGAMFGLCAMTRLNNAMPIAGLVLVLCIWLFFAHRRAFVRHAAAFVAGIALTVLPFVAYFWAKGALDAFFYAAFTHNMLYATYVNEDTFSRRWWLASEFGQYAKICGLFAVAGLACGWRAVGREAPGLRAALIGLVCAAGFAGASALLSRKGYNHYLLTCIPPAVAGCAAVIAMLERLRLPKIARGALLGALALAACYTLYVNGEAQMRRANDLLARYPAYDAQCVALAEHIPPQERGDVLGYRVEPKWYVASGITPARRLFFMQEILAMVDPALIDELVDMFENDPPRWLPMAVNRNYPPHLVIHPRVQELIDRRYESVAINDYNELFRLVR